MRQLTLARGLQLPLEAITMTFAILAIRGVGKSYTGMVMTEEMVGAGLPVVVLDPIGVFWGLRSSADGKRPGLPIVVLGGDHGDVPLESTAGTVIADWVIKHRQPCILDLSHFRKAEQRRFVADFGERLYQKNREPLHLMVDEADSFCPQRMRPDEARMLGAMEDLVRRGRARGIGLTLITQRSAVLNKDVLTQVECLIAMRTVSPQDRRAVEAWIDVHDDKGERDRVMASLPSLKVGEAWFWSPGWLGILSKHKIRRRHTFDSSATPKLGKKITAPKLAPVDLEALGQEIADTIERHKAEDPKRLRVQIAKLQRRIKELEDIAPPPTPELPAVSTKVLDAVRVAHGILTELASLQSDGKQKLSPVESAGEPIESIRHAGGAIAGLAPPKDRRVAATFTTLRCTS